MGGGARALARQLKTAGFFFQKSPKPGGSKSVKTVDMELLRIDKLVEVFHFIPMPVL